MRRITTYGRSQPIYGEYDPAEQWYCIISGAALNYVVLADGRRRIVDFLLPGDFFGFSSRHRHHFGAAALVDGTTVASYPRRGVEAMADGDPRMARQIREIAFKRISRSQARLLALGRVTSLGKVGSFLTEMAQRSSEQPAEMVDLPMSRYDIADYLALSVETVSRAFSELKRCGAIRFRGMHRIQLIDPKLLEDGFDRPGLPKPIAARRNGSFQNAGDRRRHGLVVEPMPTD